MFIREFLIEKEPVLPNKAKTKARDSPFKNLTAASELEELCNESVVN